MGNSPRSPKLVPVTCPKCGRRIAWVIPGAAALCKYCKCWVKTDKSG